MCSTWIWEKCVLTVHLNVAEVWWFVWAGRRKKTDDQHMHITKYWLHDWDICLVTTVHLMFAPENSELAEYLQLLCTITAAVPQIILQMFVLLPVSQKLRLMFTQTYIKLQRKRNTGCVRVGVCRVCSITWQKERGGLWEQMQRVGNSG